MEQRSDCPHCSDTRGRLYERDTGQGIVQYCHNCGYKNYVPHKARAPSETVQYIKQYLTKDEETNIVKEIRLPWDFSNEIPKQARLWLSKYGITPDEVETFGIGWSECNNRLILPVYNDDRLVYYQGRTFKPVTKDNPKYKNVKQVGARNVFFVRGWDRRKEIDELCIVEDILSAIKVGRHTPCLALLGSYFPPEINPLYRRANKVLIWLDSDKYTTAIKQAKLINTLTGKPVHVINTELDPKEQSNDTIIRSIERS